MRVLAVILLFAIVLLPAAAQQDASRPDAGPSVPKGPCRFERLSSLRQVKRIPPIQELMHFDLSVLTEHRVFFPIGTTVMVNRQAGLWSCVTGPLNYATSGWPFRTGRMESSLLGPVEERQSESGFRY